MTVAGGLAVIRFWIRFFAVFVAVVASGLLAISASGSHQSAKNGCTSPSVVNGSLTSPSFTNFSSSNQVVVDYRTWWEIESVAPGVFDQMTVEFSLDGGTIWQVAETLNSSAPSDPSPGTPPDAASDVPLSNQGLQVPPNWALRSIELPGSGGAGNVRVRFTFAPGDERFNGFRGWGLDDVTLSDGFGGQVTTFNFEGPLPADWEATGFWHVQANPENVSIVSGINPELVTLASGDNGSLPAAFNGSGIAWFGEAATGTYCGPGSPAEPAVPEQPPAQEPPAQQEQPQQPPPPPPPQTPAQVTPRDPFPPDIETAPTLEQLSDPAPFQEINVAMEDGPVFVRLPGGRGGAARASQLGTPSGFIPLTQAAQVPVGSIMEASRGRISLESTANASGSRLQRAQFFAGRFQMLQRRARRPVTEMLLKGGSFRGCGSARQSASWSRNGAQAAQRRRQGRRVRRVWGNGRGNFRTRGRYSSATVRGTMWLTEDRCNGTLTRVARRPRTNRVEVRDLVQRRTRLLRAGQSYFAPRPLGRR